MKTWERPRLQLSIEGKEYIEHHRDVIDGTGWKISQEDKYELTGFTYDHGPDNGTSYNGAKFYYTRNQYTITFFNGDKQTTSKAIYYEAPISSFFTDPTEAPTGKEGYKFIGWFDNKDCQGTPYDFDGKTMPADNLVFYAGWKAPTYDAVFYLTVDGMDGVGDSEKVMVPIRESVSTEKLAELTALLDKLAE